MLGEGRLDALHSCIHDFLFTLHRGATVLEI
jgi:hypothetical protein